MSRCLFAVCLLLAPEVLRAQLAVVPDAEPQQLFGGAARSLRVIWHNASDQTVDAELHTRLFEASSATALPLGDAPWKRLRVLPGQTVVESATLGLPEVRGATRFLVQWVDGTNAVLGRTDVLVHPADLLAEFKTLAGGMPLGVFDPDNELKPLLNSAAVDFLDLEVSGVADFAGRLAVIGPFQSRARMREGLPGQLKALAWKGVAVVWLQPPPDGQSTSAWREPIKPSFYAVPLGKGAVVVAQAGLVARLAASPQAQLNLVQLARLALHPEPLDLPDFTQTP